MIGFEEVGKELLRWVQKGFFNHVWYYIKDYSDLKLIFVLEDLGATLSEISIKPNQKLLGTLGSQGFSDYKDSHHSVSFPGYRSGYSPAELKKIPHKELMDLNTTHYFKSKPNSFLLPDVSCIPKIEQAIWLLLFSNKEIEEFTDSIQGGLIMDNEKGETVYDYGFNFGLEYFDGEEYIREIFLDFDISEYDILINFSKPTSENIIINKYKSILYKDEFLSNNKNIKLFGVDIHKSINVLEKTFLIRNKTTSDLLKKYHSAIEDIFNIVFKNIEPKIFSSIPKLKVPIKELMSKNKINYIITLIRTIHPHTRITSIDKMVTILEFISLEEVTKTSPILKFQALSILNERINFLREIRDFSDYRNKLAHSNLVQFSESNISDVIKVYRAIISFLIEFHSALQEN